MRKLKEDPIEMKEMKEAFMLICPYNDEITLREFMILVQSFGVFIPYSQVEIMLERIGVKDKNKIYRRHFLEFMNHPDVRRVESFNQIVESLSVFETKKIGRGKINLDHMKKVLMVVGNKLTRKEFNYLVRDLDLDKSGNFSTVELATLLRTKKDEGNKI